jgi:hypothetical protein
MNLLTKLRSLIATVGVNPNWIAFNAHCWFSYAVAFTFPHLFVWIPMALVAGVKEFYFDKHFESPPQTFIDNVEDFAGYMTGLGLAILATHL